MERKDLLGGVVDVDEKGNRIVMNWSAVEELDHDGDIIRASAYTKTISENGPQGKDLIYWLTDHRADTDHIAGKLIELSMVGKYLQAVGRTSDTQKGRDILMLYQDGIIKQHSVGFITVRTERAKEGRIIHEIKLYEGSSVLWGANENTRTVSVGKSAISVDECKSDMDMLIKALRNGKYSDDTFGLLEIRLKQIQSKYDSLVSSPSDLDTRNDNAGAPADATRQEKELIKSLDELKGILSWN